MQCQILPKVDMRAQTRSQCFVDAEDTPRVISIIVGANTFFFEVRLCAFHTAALAFESGMAPG